MTRSATILRNVASNWAGFLLNAAVTLVLTPFVLHQLGPSGYGVWVLTSSVIGYYGLLDLGFRGGVTQYLTKYLALGDHTKASECLSSAVAVLACLGAAMFGLSFAAAHFAPRYFNLPSGTEREAFWCILIVGSSTAIQFALQPYTSIFTATQRFDLANAIGVVTRLLTACGIAFALKAHLGLVGVAGATCFASVIDYVVRWRVACGLVPGIGLSLKHARWSRLREMSSFGAWNFLMSLNGYVYQHVPNLLVGTLMPIAAVGHYALATGLIRQIYSILSPVPQVLYPAATELHVRGDRAGLERLYHDGSRMMLLVLASIVLPAAFWCDDFYRLWLGSRYIGGGQLPSVAVLFQILLISVTTDNSSNIASQILVGAGRVRTVALALVFGSITNLTASIVLVRHYGLIGLPIATVIASVAIDLIAMPFLLQRNLNLPVVVFIRRAVTRPALVAVLQVIWLLSVRSLGPATDWSQLIVRGGIAGVGAGIIVLAVGVTADERRMLVQPLQRQWSRFRELRAVAAIEAGAEEIR